MAVTEIHMKIHQSLVTILFFLVALPSSVVAQDQVDQPISPKTLEAYTEGLLSGADIRYGLFGRRPPEWIEKATGDEMLRRATSGELPDDDAFSHVGFVYGAYVDNCRRYYMAFRITGDERFLEQLRQYARLMDWIQTNRPWLVLPKDRRAEKPKDWVATVPHAPAAASNFIGYALSARLTLQLARTDRTLVTPEQQTEARIFLEKVVRYLDSKVTGNGAIDRKSGLPTVAAEIVDKVPYNQSTMYYAVLGVTAAGLEDLQNIEGHDNHGKTIDLYTRIVRAGVTKFVEHSDVTKIQGRPYVFQSYTPDDVGMTVRDPKTRERVPLRVEGHPVFRYPEGAGHSGGEAINLLLLWETDSRFGVTESLLTGIANTYVDYVLRGRVALKDGTTGPPATILSPWTVQGRPDMKWKRMGRAYPLYASFLPFNEELAEASRQLNGRSRKEMDSPDGTHYILFAHYLQAKRSRQALLHLPLTN